jgi:chromosomal replication initiation ATPase DnaA
MMRVLGRRAQDATAARLAVDVTAYALKVSAQDVIEGGRGSADVAMARRVAMYLCHVAFELSLQRVAEAFARDRSTVAYACHTIEDRRDDPRFDAWIASLEMTLRTAPPPTLSAPAERGP